MQDSVFLDNRTFQRVWQRVAGSTDAPAAAPPEADTLTDLLAECIRAKAAGAAFYTALAQRIRTGHQQLLGIAAQERAHQKELQVEYFLHTGGTQRSPPARVWVRRRRIFAASIRRSSRWRSGSTRRQTPRRPRSGKR